MITTILSILGVLFIIVLVWAVGYCDAEKDAAKNGYFVRKGEFYQVKKQQAPNRKDMQ